MTWEYLKDKTKRYDFIRKHTRDLGHVVELCNGYGELEKYLDCNSYIGCDKLTGELDNEFVKTVEKCDTLIALGHGGFEIDKNEKESSTLTSSINYIIEKFCPKNLILESVNKYQPIIDGIVNDNYYVEVNRFEEHGETWVDERTLRIFTDKRYVAGRLDDLWIDVKIPYEPGNNLAKAYNRAIEGSRAEWVLLLDHDLFICNPRWYEICLDAIRQLQGEKVGWITAVCNRIGGGIQLSSPPNDNDDILDHIKYARKCYRRFGDNAFEIKKDLSGFFILTNKTAWSEVGGFRHMCKSIYGIDNDYRRRLVEAGFGLYILSGLYFYHLYRKKTEAFKGF